MNDFLSRTSGLVLLITNLKRTYKAFDDVSPTPYQQAWSTYYKRSGDEPLEDRTVLEELLHFLQLEIWTKAHPNEFALDDSVVAQAAPFALDQQHYVYDADCTRYPSCLQPEFFFCAMTTYWSGWPDPGSPSAREWTLKDGGKSAVEAAFPDLTGMVTRMQAAKQLPAAWPTVPSREELEEGVTDAGH